MQIDSNEVLRRKEELRRAVSDLRDRGLYTAARFAAELLSGMFPPCEGDGWFRRLNMIAKDNRE